MSRKADEWNAAATVLEQVAALDSRDQTPRTRPRRWSKILIAFVVVVALVAVALVALLANPKVQLTASSTARGTNASSLMGRSSGARSVIWSSSGESVGTTLTMSWSKPTTVSRIAWRAPSRSTIGAALATFSDGSTLLLTADVDGDASTEFPARTVRDVVLTVTAVRHAASAVSLSSLAIDRRGSATAAAAGDAARTALPSASSSASGSTPAALVDGARTLSTRRLGAAWASAAGDDDPWVELKWSTPQALTSVQMYGPARGAEVPARGVLEFSDGSRLTVGAVRGTPAGPTTIGFAPRVVDSVRFRMSTAGVGLEEFAAFEPGATPPAPAASGSADLTLTDATNCGDVIAPAMIPSALKLLCPSVGAAVGGRVTVAAAGPALSAFTVSTWVPLPGAADQGAVQTIAQGKSTKAGIVRFSVETARLPAGPITMEVVADGAKLPLAVQLVHTQGAPIAASAAPVAGRTLLYQDDFSGPLSVSRTGATSTYAAAKPDPTGPSDFGSAIFENPAWKTGNLGTIPGGYLRLRLSPAHGRADPFGYGRTQIGAILSSAAVGGGGTSAQYGYFEARMLGAPGLGTWPAFWMLSNSILVDSKAASGEVDAVELYGTDTTRSCHSVHSYTGKQSTVRCIKPAQLGDWSLQWHTYGVDITPNGTGFFIDGHEVTHEVGPTNAGDPYFFLLDLASGGGWPVDLSPTGGVSDMYVDWVRVYS